MSLLSAADIAGMRRDMALMLPDTATIQRPTVVADGGGGQTTTWTTVAGEIPCRLSPIGGGEDARDGSSGGDRISDSATATVTFEATTDVLEKDRLVIGGQTFDVQLVRMRGKWAMSKRCEVRESA